MFQIRIRENTPVAIPGSAPFGSGQRALTISPDGKLVVYVGQSDTTTFLFLRHLDNFQFHRINGSEGAYYPFFSPDSKWIAFFSNGKLKKVSVSGAEPITICNIIQPYGGTWSDQGKIVIANAEGRTLLVVSVTGKILDKIPGNFHWPSAVKAAEVFYTDNSNHLYSINLVSHAQKLLLKGGSSPSFVDPGFLVYSEWGRLMCVRFNFDKLEVQGTPVVVQEQVRTEPLYHGAQYSFSQNGLLVFISGGSADKGEFVWVKRNGQEEGKLSLAANYFGMHQLSPDGKHLAYTFQESFDYMDNSLWVYDITRDFNLLLAKGAFGPTWLPDSKSIMYTVKNGEKWSLVNKMLSNEKTDTILTDENLIMLSRWTPDHKYMLYEKRPGGIWLFDDSTRERRIVVHNSESEWAANFSPDGKYFTYMSDVSGQYEIYVQNFPSLTEKIQISKNGAIEPYWSYDGKEIVYRSADLKSIFSVPVTLSPTFKAGQPMLLWSGDYLDTPGLSYHFTSDGNHFVMKKSVVNKNSITEIQIIENWFENIKKLSY
jgi:roadblock/LC7 domain-containing protein